MDAAARALVRARAGDRCEYCHSHQDDEPFFRFQIEHVIPRQHGGTDDSANLALACPHCNQHKGPNLTGFDPFDGTLTPLFNPRLQRWEDHFARRGPLVMGQTAVGRTTVRVLDINNRVRVELRASLPPSYGVVERALRRNPVSSHHFLRSPAGPRPVTIGLPHRARPDLLPEVFP